MDYSQITALVCLFSHWLAEPLMRRGQARELLTTQFENNTTILIVVVAMGGVNLALLFPLFGVKLPAVPSSTVAWFLIIILVIGIMLRYWSMVVLGEMFTRTLRITPDHVLVQSGPYRRVRHPGYIANILVYWSATTLLTPSLLLGSAVGIALYLAYDYRIRYEEKMLVSFFGKSYRSYQEHTWKLIPWVY